jgi:hypothetical protein
MVGEKPCELEIQHHRMPILCLYVVAAFEVDLRYLSKSISSTNIKSTHALLALALAVRPLFLLLSQNGVDLSDALLEAVSLLLIALHLEDLLGKSQQPSDDLLLLY